MKDLNSIILIQSLLCTRQLQANLLMVQMNDHLLFDLSVLPCEDRKYCPYFIDEEIGAQRGFFFFL